MTAAGADPRKIWKDTGWMKGGEGKWRFEIDDSQAMFNPSGVGASRVENDIQFSPWQESLGPPVGGLIEHPGMKAAYDSSIAPNAFIKNGDPLGGYKGAFNMDNKDITVFAPVKAQDGRSTVLHELQHAVQGREGFARGGNPDSFGAQFDAENARLPVVKAQVEQMKGAAFEQSRDALASNSALVDEAKSFALKMGEFSSSQPVEAQISDYLLSKNDGYKRAYKELSELQQSSRLAPHDRYNRLAGEAEARAVQSRMGLNAQQRRDLFPLDSYDVPVNSLIYRTAR
jgi:hypothetical protein